MSEIDRIAIAGLEKQYGIPRSVLYDRMNALGIKRTKIGSRAYIDGEALQLLNNLDAHMKAGQPMALFLESVEKPSEQTKIAVAGQATGQTEILIKALAQLNEVVAHLMNQQPGEELYAWQKLEEVSEHNWHIPTSQLLSLLGRTTIPSLDDHHRFSRMGFTFHRMGKVGRQYEWRVSKMQP